MVAKLKGKVVRNSEAAMIERKDGNLFAVWQEFQKGEGDSDCFPGRPVATTSRDGDRTWATTVSSSRTSPATSTSSRRASSA